MIDLALRVWQAIGVWCEKYLSVYNPHQGGW
jgi:hypothetical protein